MRLHILSDLHLEFAPVELPAVEADAIILAGDIHVGREGTHWARKRFRDRPVIYALGNHEFYHHALPKLTEQLKLENHGGQVHVLENDAIEINGWTILGCTLWTDFKARGAPEAAMQAAEGIMTDYSIIQFHPEHRTLRARDTIALHNRSVAWLRGELGRHDPARTIVVTHHAPSLRCEPAVYANSPLSSAFASNLDALVEHSGVPLWIHGHTHYNVDYQLGSTRVLTNQRGYPAEHCRGFNPALVVEI
jgi:predicted phosphodiesterase